MLQLRDQALKFYLVLFSVLVDHQVVLIILKLEKLDVPVDVLLLVVDLDLAVLQRGAQVAVFFQDTLFLIVQLLHLLLVLFQLLADVNIHLLLALLDVALELGLDPLYLRLVLAVVYLQLCDLILLIFQFVLELLNFELLSADHIHQSLILADHEDETHIRLPVLLSQSLVVIKQGLALFLGRVHVLHAHHHRVLPIVLNFLELLELRLCLHVGLLFHVVFLGHLCQLVVQVFELLLVLVLEPFQPGALSGQKYQLLLILQILVKLAVELIYLPLEVFFLCLELRSQLIYLSFLGLLVLFMQGIDILLVLQDHFIDLRFLPVDFLLHQLALDLQAVESSGGHDHVFFSHLILLLLLSHGHAWPLVRGLKPFVLNSDQNQL